MNLRFWRNLALIGFAHVVVITGLVQWSRQSKAAPPQNVVWISEGGSKRSVPSPASSPPLDSAKTSPPTLEPAAEIAPSPESEAMLVAAKSEIELPAATVAPKPTAAPTPGAKTKVMPRPKRPKPKPTATPKPKPSPKKLVVAKVRPAPKVVRAVSKDEDVDAPKREERAIATPAQPPQPKNTPDQSAPKQPGGGSADGRSAGGGGGTQSQFGWYGRMLHDRFYSEWAQPTRVAADQKNSVVAKIRIESDGRVSSFEIVRPSGNAELDQSVAAVAGRVTQVEPLPAGLGNGNAYDVKISFELNAE